MYRFVLFALAVLACAVPVLASATCDTQLSHIHVVRKKGSPTTYFTAYVTRGQCVRGAAPTSVTLYSKGRAISNVALATLAPGKRREITVALPQKFDIRSLAVRTQSKNGPSTQIPIPFPNVTPVPFGFSGGTDAKPTTKIIHVPSERPAR